MLKFVLFVLISTLVLSQPLVCPIGYAKEQIPGYVAPTNGCGPQTSRLSSAVNKFIQSVKPGFEECCNAHDICYTSCMATQKMCDLQFQNCLLSKCSAKDIPCRLAGVAMYQAVDAFGKKHYDAGQREACRCVKIRSTSRNTLYYEDLAYDDEEEEDIANEDEEAEEENEIETLDLSSFLEATLQ